MIVTTRNRLIDTDTFTPEDVSIRDISHSLSQQCRYNGNTPRHYSVAEHAVYVARLVSRVLATDPEYDELTYFEKVTCVLGALCHDNPEYIYGDLIRPVKKAISGLTEIDEKVTPVCEAAFHLETLDDKMRALIKWADNEVAHCEKNYFFPWAEYDSKWADQVPYERGAFSLEGLAEGLTPGMEAITAKGMFLYTFFRLTDGYVWKDI